MEVYSNATISLPSLNSPAVLDCHPFHGGWEGSIDGDFREPLDVCVKFSILENFILQRAHKLVGTEKCSLPCSPISHHPPPF